MSLKEDFKVAAYTVGGMATLVGGLFTYAVIEEDNPRAQPHALVRASASQHTELLDDSTEAALAFIFGSAIAVGSGVLLLSGRKDKPGPGPRL